jgi:putative N6-adenine-specific DNA methylase
LKLTAKTFLGLEPVLEKELKNMGASNIKPVKRAVAFEGNKEMLYKCNLHLRTAIRVLEYVTSFDAQNENELYEKAKLFDWAHYLDVDNTFAIDSVVNSNIFRNSQYAGLRLKDAICDFFRYKTGKRPSVDLKQPTLLINLHIAENKITISFDSSGQPLNRRGYRTGEHEAPINEVLAAGMILLSGWSGEVNFMDMMCGSGTIVLEAAMIAANIPPNLKRNDFGFMRWRNFDATLWNKVVNEAKSAIKTPEIRISGSDISMETIDIARQSALDFGLKQYIDFKVASFKEMRPVGRKGVLIMNPPYDERLKVNLGKLYSDIGDKLKKSFAGWDTWIISSSFDALEITGLKPVEKHTLLNGSLECGYWKLS